MAAGRNIKGITIEIGGNTTGLQKALSDVNGKIKSTQEQLKDVNNLLKLDPSNTMLVAQKQELLRDAVAETTGKLNKLEDAQDDVTAALKAGKIGREQYMAFQREIEETKVTLRRYESELADLNTEQDRLTTNTDRLSKLFDATGTAVDDYADVLGSKLVTAIKNGSASSDQLKSAIEKIGKSATDGKADIKQITDALDTVDDGQAIQNLIQELRDAGNQADNTAEQLDEMGNTLTGGILIEAAEQLSTVGDKITELGDKAKDAFTETQNATVKASAYFGETGEAAEQTAGIIQDVYTEGVGESIDAVSNAVITVKKNLKDLDETELKHLTEQAITLDELYGIDMNETLRGVNSLMQQYGITAQEAMDYIVKGTQNGLDKTNELGDNLSEYSGKFAQAGYSTREYFQLLQNGLEGGAYNLDKVNDAINEVTTRLADGTMADSLSKINEETGEVEAGTGGWGTEVENVFKQWQQGGATQKQVIDAIVKDIHNTENQQDKLNKAALAFGTMGEDGNTKFIESLTSVGDAYDDVNGAAENMFSSSTTESQKFDAIMRQLEQNLIPLGETMMSLANKIIPPLSKGVKAIGEFFAKLPEPVQNFVVILGALIAAFTTLTPVIMAVVTIVGTLGAATLGPIIGIIAGVAAAIAAIIAIVKNWGAITEWFGNLWQAVKEKCAKAWDKLVEKFQGIFAWWSGIWSQVGEFFFGIWQNICKFFTKTIPDAWQQVVSFFKGIPAWWSNIWQQVRAFFDDIWKSMMQNPVLSGIVTTIQKLWKNCVTTLKGIWSGLTQAASGAWELLKNTILAPVLFLIDLVTGNFEQLESDTQNIWNNIQNATSAIWDGIKTVVSSLTTGLVTHVVTLAVGLTDTLSKLWGLMKQAASTTWENMKQTASMAWSNLKSTVVNTATNLKDSAIQVVTDLRESVSQNWENVKQTASAAWENLKTTVINTVINLKDSAVQEFANLKNWISQTWIDLKTATSTAWQNLKDYVTLTAQNMKQSAAQAFQNMVSGIRNTLSNLGSVVKNGFQSAINFITSLPDQALTWGSDLVNGIADGIRNAISNVKNAVSDVASTIRSFLHFSVPDEGPLTEYESWMPDFMKGLAKGIEESKGIVVDAISGLSADMTLNPQIPQMAKTMNVVNGNEPMLGASQNNDAVISAVENLGNRMVNIMSQYFPQFANRQIVMDTGALVGEIAPGMDMQLGRIAAHKGRGI